MLKKLLALTIAVIMLFGITSCNSQQESTDPTGTKEEATKEAATQEQATQAQEEEPEPMYPIVDDGSITLKYYMPIAANAAKFIESYAENEAYQEIQKATGINIEFIQPPAGQYKDNLNLVLASGDLPDMIMNFVYYVGGLTAALDDGLIIDLTPYMQDCAPDYYTLITSTDEVKRETHLDDKVLGFYQLRFADSIPYARNIVRKDWLDEFGLDTPMTLDEFEAYFKAVQENYPEADIFAFGTGQRIMDIWLGAFDMLYSWFNKDGVISHYYNDENLLDFLTLFNEWYDKGYISKDGLSLEDTQIFALFDSGEMAMYVDSVDSSLSRTSALDDVEIDSTPYPRKIKDSLYHGSLANWPVHDVPRTTVVTSQCEYPEEAIKFLNYGYTEVGARTYNYGVEGKTYTMVDGVPQYTEWMLWPEDRGMTSSNTSYIYKIHLAPKLCTASDLVLIPGVARSPEGVAWRSKWFDDENVDNSYRLPPFSYTGEENDELTEIMVDVDTYAQEMILSYITGAEPLSTFEDYLATLEEMDFDRAVEIVQGAYDRYMSN